MWFGVVTLFPSMFDALLEHGVTGRAYRDSIFGCRFFNPRDYADNENGYIDDRPFGGGAGMVMQPGPIIRAVQDAKRQAPTVPRVVYLSPVGRRFEQAEVARFLETTSWIMIAGRYEGIDHRVIESVVDEVWSIGDYVLSGGELASMVVMDTLLRQVPGVVGDVASVLKESFSEGLLEHPHYTRPAVYEGMAVPEVLLQGDHEAIRQWRLKESLKVTAAYRPDLLARYEQLSEEECSDVT